MLYSTGVVWLKVACKRSPLRVHLRGSCDTVQRTPHLANFCTENFHTEVARGKPFAGRPSNSGLLQGTHFFNAQSVNLVLKQIPRKWMIVGWNMTMLTGQMLGEMLN